MSKSRNNYPDLDHKINKYIKPLHIEKKRYVDLDATVATLLEVIYQNYSDFHYHKEKNFIAYNKLCHEIYDSLKQANDENHMVVAIRLQNYFIKNFNVDDDFFDFMFLDGDEAGME